MHFESEVELLSYKAAFGAQVRKKSNKPFKSALKIVTVNGFIDHPKTGRLCYTFLEDDSYVECIKCIILD